MVLTASRTFRLQQLCSLRFVLRAVGLCGALGAAFLVGNLLGHLPYGDKLAQAHPGSVASSPSGSAGAGSVESTPARVGRFDAELSEWTVATAYSSIAAPSSGEGKSASNLRLRLRAVSRISSGEAQAGERITFVTEDAIEDEDGHPLPAGSRVEGIITQASVAGEISGRLVLEIHSLHVGNQALALRALPVAAFGGVTIPRSSGAAAASEPGGPRTIRQPRSPYSNPLQEVPEWVLGKAGLRGNSNNPATITPKPAAPKVTREAVVPQEAILEFELLTRPVMPVEGAPGQAPALEDPQRSSPPASPEWRPKPRPRTARG